MPKDSSLFYNGNASSTVRLPLVRGWPLPPKLFIPSAAMPSWICTTQLWFAANFRILAGRCCRVSTAYDVVAGAPGHEPPQIAPAVTAVKLAIGGEQLVRSQGLI